MMERREYPHDIILECLETVAVPKDNAHLIPMTCFISGYQI